MKVRNIIGLYVGQEYLLQRSIQDEQDLLELNAAFFFIVVVVFVTVMHSSPSCHALLTVMHL